MKRPPIKVPTPTCEPSPIPTVIPNPNSENTGIIDIDGKDIYDGPGDDIYGLK